MHQDTRTIAELISSHEQGYSLDQRFYTDPAIFELELERIITRNWILAGHQSELPEPGDFKLLNVANESNGCWMSSDWVQDAAICPRSCRAVSSSVPPLRGLWRVSRGFCWRTSQQGTSTQVWPIA